MHELAICQAMLDQVQVVAGNHGNAAVTGITVAVGPLSGVEPKLLERAFMLARAGTAAAGANLELQTTPVRIRCRRCGAESIAAPACLVCADCGDFHTELVSGDELILQRVELAKPVIEPGLPDSGERTCAIPADAI